MSQVDALLIREATNSDSMRSNETSTINETTTNFSIDLFMNPAAFPHEVDRLELLETHISWVILTGPFAYKIKKPIKFDFVDYSTLGQRKRFCEREIELNRRFAPELYVGVATIVQSNGGPAILKTEIRKANSSEPIEYAVQMRQFPQDAIVAARLCHPDLTSTGVEQLGRDLSAFHQSIETASKTLPSAQPQRILADANDNFKLLLDEMTDKRQLQTLRRLREWTREQFELCKTEFDQRLKHANVRRCHGDLHLKNIIQLNGRLIPFDGIEFNEAFQWIDTASEIAFPLMDFVARGRADLGWRLLNAWLEESGDFEAVRLLRFYAVYRAMVRAKVTWLNPKNHGDGSAAKVTNGPWDKYLTAANYFAFDLRPSLTMTHGFSGSGKSTAALRCVDRSGGLRIRSDVERTRLAEALGEQQKYSRQTSDRVYRRLLLLARQTILAGIPVVVDATFLRREQRAPFESLAAELGVPWSILHCAAPQEELCRRIRNRKGDASEATVEVLRSQMENHDPLTESEQQFASDFSNNPKPLE